MTTKLNGVKLKALHRKEAQMYEYRKLRGRIVEKYGTLSKFAEEIGLSMVSVSKKMNCETGFSQKDIEKWADVLQIKKEEYPEYFFA